MQQSRHEERAFAAICIDKFEIVRATKYDLSFSRQVCNAFAYLIALSLAGQRAHVDVLHARVTDAYLTEGGGQCTNDVTCGIGRGNDASNCRALLSCLGRHLVNDFLNEEIEFRRAGYSVRAEN